MNKLLRAKNRQLFLISFGLPFLYGMLFSFSFLSGHMFDLVLKLLPLVLLIVAGLFFSWTWAVTTELNKEIPPPHQLNLKWFRVAFRIASIFVLFFIVSFHLSMQGITGFLLYKLPDHFIVEFITEFLVPVSVVFCMYVAVKTIKTAEMKKEVAFLELLPELVMMLFFPFGIWILQEKINNVINFGKGN